MSVKNCYVEEKINDAGSSTDITALTLEVDQNTTDISKLQNDYDLIKTSTVENTTKITTNTDNIGVIASEITTFGLVYSVPISQWLTTDLNLNSLSGEWTDAFTNVAIGMTYPGMYNISANFIGLVDTGVGPPPDVKSVGIQLFQLKNGVQESVATMFTATSVISPEVIAAINMYAIPCNISFPIEITEPNLPLTMQIYYSCENSFQFFVTSNIPPATLPTSYWSSTMNVSPVGFTAQCLAFN